MYYISQVWYEEKKHQWQLSKMLRRGRIDCMSTFSRAVCTKQMKSSSKQSEPADSGPPFTPTMKESGRKVPGAMMLGAVAMLSTTAGLASNAISCRKRAIKICISCSQQCSGTLAPRAPHLTVSLYLCRFESNGQGRSRALEGRRISSKSLSRVWDGDKGVAGMKGKKCVHRKFY